MFLILSTILYKFCQNKKNCIDFVKINTVGCIWFTVDTFQVILSLSLYYLTKYHFIPMYFVFSVDKCTNKVL